MSDRYAHWLNAFYLRRQSRIMLAREGVQLEYGPQLSLRRLSNLNTMEQLLEIGRHAAMARDKAGK